MPFTRVSGFRPDLNQGLHEFTAASLTTMAVKLLTIGLQGERNGTEVKTLNREWRTYSGSVSCTIKLSAWILVATTILLSPSRASVTFINHTEAIYGTANGPDTIADAAFIDSDRVMVLGGFSDGASFGLLTSQEEYSTPYQYSASSVDIFYGILELSST